MRDHVLTKQALYLKEMILFYTLSCISLLNMILSFSLLLYYFLYIFFQENN
jgi:hypothetical protein